MATAMTGKFSPWQGRVLTEADGPNPDQFDEAFVLRQLEMERAFNR